MQLYFTFWDLVWSLNLNPVAVLRRNFDCVDGCTYECDLVFRLYLKTVAKWVIRNNILQSHWCCLKIPFVWYAIVWNYFMLLVLRHKGSRQHKLVGAAFYKERPDHLDIDLSTLIWKQIAQHQSDCFFFLNGVSFGVYRCISWGNGVVVLLFGLLLLSDLCFNRSVVDLSNQFGDNCLLV